MKIVPAILAENLEDFRLRLAQAESFADYVQIDLMDGVFVPSRSFPPERLNSINTPLSFEVHLMVKEPARAVGGMRNPGLKRVFFHVESDVAPLELISQLRDRGLSPGLAIKPGTGLGELKDVAREVDALLFLAVDPCCYGNPFKPEVIGKVAEARGLFPAQEIAVDGGVSLENLGSFIESGADYACVGSRIFLDGEPSENYWAFVEKTRQLEERLETPRH